MKKHDLSSLRHLFLAGEPLDEPTARWTSDALGVPIVDNYWQTETGWPILSAQPGRRGHAAQVRQPVVPRLRLRRAAAARGHGRGGRRRTRRACCDRAAAAAGLHDHGLGRRRALREDLFHDVPGQARLFDLRLGASATSDGYYFILGRTDDVINVAGHRLGTREIEEAVQAHPGIAEVAVVGVADALKGQIPVAFAVVKDPAQIANAEGIAQFRKEVMDTVDRELGAIGRPGAVHFVPCCRRPARASCCGARSRRSPKAATPATSRRSRIRARSNRSRRRWRGRVDLFQLEERPMTAASGVDSSMLTGTVTFLFSDIEGSSRLWREVRNRCGRRWRDTTRSHAIRFQATTVSW